MYKIMIVEDNNSERVIIKTIINEFQEFSITEEYETFTDALPSLIENNVDLAIIDISLPEGDFFSLIEQNNIDKSNLPYIIFVTAHDRFAINAFDIGAIDYILKPVTKGRFKQSIEQFILFQQKILVYLNFKKDSKTMRVLESDIFYITANKKRTVLHTENTDFDCPKAIGELQEDLGKGLFIRIHRKHIVNKEKISQLIHEGNGAYSVILSIPDAPQLPVGRKYIPQVRSIF